MAFQAFSAGPKNCVGSRLARLEALTIMSSILQNYRVETVGHQKEPPQQFLALTLRPKNGIRFRFFKRTKQEIARLKTPHELI